MVRSHQIFLYFGSLVWVCGRGKRSVGRDASHCSSKSCLYQGCGEATGGLETGVLLGSAKEPRSVGLSTTLLTDSWLLVLNKSMNERMAKRERHEPKATWVLHREGLNIPGLYQHVGGALPFYSERWFSQIKKSAVWPQRVGYGPEGFSFPSYPTLFRTITRSLKTGIPWEKQGCHSRQIKNTGVKEMWGRGRGEGRRDSREKRGRSTCPPQHPQALFHTHFCSETVGTAKTRNLPPQPQMSLYTVSV